MTNMTFNRTNFTRYHFPGIYIVIISNDSINSNIQFTTSSLDIPSQLTLTLFKLEANLLLLNTGL